jgi:ParB/RepB/Spo0J family partition protein
MNTKEAVQSLPEYVNVPLAELVECSTNPRKMFDDEKLEELAESIRSKGVLSPLLARRVNGHFEIVSGARRHRAAQRAGLQEIPVRIVAPNDEEAFETQLIENIQRADVHPFEEAQGFRALLEREGAAYTVEKIAAKTGKASAHIATHEGSADTPPPPPATGKTRIEPLTERRAQYEMTWPNVIRIDHEYRPQLTLDANNVKPLVLDAYQTPMIAELAPMIDGKPDFTKLKEIHLEELAKRFRMQRIVFETASEVYDQMAPKWKGSREYLLAQLVRLVEQYIDGGRVIVDPPLFNEDDKRRRIIITLNMTKVVQHLWEAIRFENALTLEPVFDTERPIRSTGDMLPWYSGKACEHTKRSHINMCVYDSRWEANESLEFDRNQNVRAWVKNDHIGFEITYSFKGIIHKFRPDYLVRLTNGKTLILEIKGQDDQQQQTKREFLSEWVRAVNGHAGFGTWAADVSRHPTDIRAILARHS